MNSDITDVMADLVLEATPDLEARLEYQTEALRESKCINPVIGEWIDANDVKYLLSTLSLEDTDFAAKFPSITPAIGLARQRLVATIEAHLEQCQHCSLKRGYDLELEAHIKQACQQNNNMLLQLLEEEEVELTEKSEQPGDGPKGIAFGASTK
jgi:hypothetical protein